MSPVLLVLQVFLIVVIGLASWILILKLVRRFWKFPIPAVLTGLIDNPVRRRMQPPEKAADRMLLQTNMIVLEVGPGKGTYTFEVARRVPGGKVIAIDVQESVVKKLEQKCKALGITNVEPKVMDIYDLDFENGTFDRVFMICCLPEIPDPVRALRELNRVLKPEGLLLLAEFLPDPDYPLPGTEIKWAKDANFTLRSKDGYWFAYYLIFSK